MGKYGGQEVGSNNWLIVNGEEWILMAGYFVLSEEGKFQKSTKDGKNLLKDIYLKCTLGVRWCQLWPPDGLLCLTTELHSPLQVDVDMKQKCCCKCCYRAAVVWWPQYTAQYETRGGLSSVSAQRHSGSVQLKRRVLNKEQVTPKFLSV